MAEAMKPSSTANTKEIAAKVCAVHGHSIAYFKEINRAFCSKCGMTIAEIRDEEKLAKAAS